MLKKKTHFLNAYAIKKAFPRSKLCDPNRSDRRET